MSSITPAILRIILALLIFAGTGRVALEPHQASAKQFRPIDLAALGLTPQDLEAVGLEGYGVDSGVFLTAKEFAASVARSEGRSAKEAIEAVEDLGLLRSYTLPLSRPSAGSGSDDAETAGIWYTILEFDTASNAGAMFEMTEADLRTGDRQVVEGAHRIGDGSILSRSEYPDESTGALVADLMLEFYTGNYYAVINTYDVALEGEFAAAARPTIATIEDLGMMLLDRIESAGGAFPPVLGTEIVRMTASDGSVETVADRYNAIDGRPQRRYAETDDALASRAEQMERDGLVSSYVVEQVVLSGDTAVPGDPRLVVHLFEFDDDSAASEWMKETALDRLAREDHITGIEPIHLPFAYGDDITGASYDAVLGGTELTGHVAWVQIGDTVARISLDAAGALDLDVIEALVEAQVDCLLGRPCGPLEVPNKLA